MILSEEIANKSNLTDLRKEKGSYESIRRFRVWLFVFSKRIEKIHCQEVPNKCLNGLDIIFTGDKKSLIEGDGKTKILMLNEFTEEALR